MVSKLITFILILFISGFVYAKCSDHDQASVTSSNEPPSDFQYLNDRLSKVKCPLEIREALSALNEGISHLKKLKGEMIAEIGSAVENELEEYDAQLKDQLIEVENTLLARNEKRTALMKDEMTKLIWEIIGVFHYGNALPRDCKEVQRRGNIDSGIYRIRPELSSVEFLVWCEMGAHGGGWTRVINRFDGSQNFYLNWTDYKNGFGNVSGEHWLGLDHLYQLTNSKSNELLFELVDWDSEEAYALYDNFKIGSESEHYKIHSIGNYTGDAGDSFAGHVQNKFSTADVDQDIYSSGNCAVDFQGAWWYSDSYSAHLTGRYPKNLTSDLNFDSAIQWAGFHGYYYRLKEVRMMVRPRIG